MRTTEPTEITQFESISWTRSFCDFPADEWTLQYRFRGPGNGFNVAASADGTDFLSEISATQSGTMSSGQYMWQAWVTNIDDATDIRMIDEGPLNVLVGFDANTTTSVDLRSDAKIMLDTIDAALLAFATSDVLEYEISTPAGSRRVKRSDKAQLTAERKYWAGIVSRENAAKDIRRGGKFGKAIKVSMSSQ